MKIVHLFFGEPSDCLVVSLDRLLELLLALRPLLCELGVPFRVPLLPFPALLRLVALFELLGDRLLRTVRRACIVVVLKRFEVLALRSFACRGWLTLRPEPLVFFAK